MHEPFNSLNIPQKDCLWSQPWNFSLLYPKSSSILLCTSTVEFFFQLWIFWFSDKPYINNLNPKSKLLLRFCDQGRINCCLPVLRERHHLQSLHYCVITQNLNHLPVKTFLPLSLYLSLSLSLSLSLFLSICLSICFLTFNSTFLVFKRLSLFTHKQNPLMFWESSNQFTHWVLWKLLIFHIIH